MLPAWANSEAALLVIITASEESTPLVPDAASASLSTLVRLIVLKVPSSFMVFSTVTVVPAVSSFELIISGEA